MMGNVWWENLEELWVFSTESSGALLEELGVVWSEQNNTLHQTAALVKPCSASSGFHGETLHCSTATGPVCDCATSPQVQTQMGIKENSMFFMWQCKSVYQSVIVRAQYSMCVSTRLHCMCLHLCASVFLWGHEQEPLPPPVFASWSKPLPCHRSFWCSGTIEPVEVLISSPIHLDKGQASPPSPVQWAKGREESWQDSGSSPPAGLSG